MPFIKTAKKKTTLSKARKTTKKAATATKKKTVKKTVAKEYPSPLVGGDLRGPQMRILQILSKKSSLTRLQISDQAVVDNASCTDYVGSARIDSVEGSLIARKFVSFQEDEVDGRKTTTFSITASGRKALAQWIKDNGPVPMKKR